MITASDIDRADHQRAEEKERELVNNNAKLIADLRAVADFLEARPSLKNLAIGGINLFAYVWNKEEFANQVRVMGTGEKAVHGNDLHFSKKFGSIELAIFSDRETVCDRVQVGEKIIPAQEEVTIPAKTIPAQPERIEPIYEWKCNPLLGTDPEDEDGDTVEEPTPLVETPEAATTGA